MSLLAIAGLSSVSFCLALLLTPVVRNAFRRYGIVDWPDGGRKAHALAVPRVGGIAIAIAYVAAYAVLIAVPGLDGGALARQLPALAALLPAAGIIFLTGLADDLVGLRPWQKLAGQTLGTALAVWGGVQIGSVGGRAVDPAWSVPLTALWLVGCTNAFNLIDGLDGLASGMGLFTTLTMFVAAVLHGDHALALATLPLCGALLGFLRYNFNPASVFLGDGGSLLIGFLLGCYSVIWSQKSATLLGMTAPVMALAIPLLDVSLSILRRWLRGQPIFGADRHHIHHKLLDRGLTHRGVVVLLYVVCGFYATLSLLASLAEDRAAGLVVVLFCGATWAGIQSLGYFEFGLASRVLLGGALKRVVHGQIVLHGLEAELKNARTADDCWSSVDGALRQFGFTRAHARLNGFVFRRMDPEAAGCAHWQLRIPLPDGDYVNLGKSLGAPIQAAVIGPLVELLHRRLPESLVNCQRNWSPESSQAGTAALMNLALAVRAGESAPREASVATSGE